MAQINQCLDGPTSKRNQKMNGWSFGNAFDRAIRTKGCIPLVSFHFDRRSREGPSDIVEAIDRFIADLATTGVPTQKLYVQLDKCSRETRKQYMLAYMESLVAWKILCTIHVLYRSIWHTHEDIDQAFSGTSEQLWSNDEITLSDLHTQLE